MASPVRGVSPGLRETLPRQAGPMDDDSRKARWEQRTEVPLAVASMVFLAAYAVRILAHGLPDTWRDLCLAVLFAAWALFAVDYAVRWRLSGQRLRFVRTHWLDTLVLLLPLLRPLRVVRVYEAVQRRHGQPRLALHARVMVYSRPVHRPAGLHAAPSPSTTRNTRPRARR